MLANKGIRRRRRTTYDVKAAESALNEFEMVEKEDYQLFSFPFVCYYYVARFIFKSISLSFDIFIKMLIKDVGLAHCAQTAELLHGVVS